MTGRGMDPVAPPPARRHDFGVAFIKASVKRNEPSLPVPVRMIVVTVPPAAGITRKRARPSSGNDPSRTIRGPCCVIGPTGVRGARAEKRAAPTSPLAKAPNVPTTTTSATAAIRGRRVGGIITGHDRTPADGGLSPESVIRALRLRGEQRRDVDVVKGKTSYLSRLCRDPGSPSR